MGRDRLNKAPRCPWSTSHVKTTIDGLVETAPSNLCSIAFFSKFVHLNKRPTQPTIFVIHTSKDKMVTWQQNTELQYKQGHISHLSLWLPPPSLSLQCLNLAFPVVCSTGSLPRWWERGIITRRQLNIRRSKKWHPLILHAKTYIELIDAHLKCGVCASTRNYCGCDAVILDRWIVSDSLDL